MSNSFESVFATRVRLFGYVEQGIVDPCVVSSVVVGSKGIRDEGTLWDFKQQLPCKLPEIKLSLSADILYQIKM